MYVATSSKFAPGIAIKSLTAANVQKKYVNFILDDTMLQYCHVFMLPTFKAYTRQQYACVLSATLAANGQTWREYSLTAAYKGLKIVAIFPTLTTKRLDSFPYIVYTIL